MTFRCCARVRWQTSASVEETRHSRYSTLKQPLDRSVS
uniref:Uncharacterized protein n=1 Tax=Anguilla anguilla TaxID=7936 RepID=A0A0E9R2W4_ANGAN